MFLIDFFGYSLPAVKVSDLLIFIAFLFMAVFLTVWFKFASGGFRTFIYRTFTDANGVPDAKLLTAFLFAMIQAFFCIRGAIFMRWPPEWLYDSNLIFIGALLGLDVANTISKRVPLASAPKPTTPTDPTEPIIESRNT